MDSSSQTSEKEKDDTTTTTNNDNNNNDNNGDDDNSLSNRKKKKMKYFEKKRNKSKSDPDKILSKRKKNNRNWNKEEGNDPRNMTPHDGSFANAEMRSLYNVTLPSFHDDDDDDGSRKHPKRKVALLLGFVGTRYGGMQMNKGQRSLHAEIELALYKAQFISKDNFGFPEKVSWSNSARTDKGVHSCAQICSVKLLLPTDDLNVIRERINQSLPDDIAVLDIVRTPRAFCARTQRSKVRYQYMLPSYVLQHRSTLQKLFQDNNLIEQEDNNKRENQNPLTIQEIQTLHQQLRHYRASEENIQQLKQALQRYVGTNKYHNYTSRKKSDDPSVNRFILAFNVEQPVIDTSTNIEWIPCQVIGQSFLLHQIRKMMSMAMDVARNATTMDIMDQSFGINSLLNIHTAPAQGLFLDMSYYDQFNKRPQAGDPLDWHSDPTAPAPQRWKQFKEQKIMKHIMTEEESQGNFIKYMYLQELHISKGNYNLRSPPTPKTDEGMTTE